MINRKNGRCYVSIMVDGRRVPMGGCATEEEAEELERAGYKGAEPDEHLTVKTWGQTWLDRRETVEKIRHIDSDRRAWKKHVEKAPIAKLPIAMLEASHLDTWLRAVRQSKTPAGKPLAPKTVREIVLLFKQCLEAAVPKHISTNPLVSVAKQHRAALRREQEKREAVQDPWTFLAGDEQRGLLTHKDIPEAHRLILACAILTGMRQGEQFNLELRDVHLDEAEPHLFVRWGGKGRPTKNGKPRRVWLSADACAVMKRWIEVLPTWAPKNAEGLVFPLKTGGRVAEGKTPLMSSTRVKGKPVRRNLFAEHLAKAGVTRPVRWHDLRHTCASSLISGTWGRRWSLEEVRGFMGWKSRASADRYSHLADDALKSAVWGASDSSRSHEEPRPSAERRRHATSRNHSAPAAGLEPATRRLTAGSIFEWSREVAPFFFTTFSTDATDLLIAIGDAAPDSHDRALTFARDLVDAAALDVAIRTRAKLVLRALEAGDVHAFDRVVDLAERVLGDAAGALESRTA